MSSRLLMALVGVAAGAVAGYVAGRVRQQPHVPPRTLQLDELNVQRVNVREEDGTLRLVLSSRSRFPAPSFRGTEATHARDVAGLVFLNDEGTENGALIFAGRRGPDGRVHHGLHLSFDKYEQDQVLQLTSQEDHADEGQQDSRVLVITDRPDWPISDLMEVVRDKEGREQQAALEEFFSNGRPQAHPRLVLGKRSDKTVGLQLHDAEGRVRLQVQVDEEGNPVMRFLNREGEVVRELP